MDSILTSVKKMLGIAEEYEHFDPDIIMHINNVFMVLVQIGVGPPNGFAIKDKSSVWSDFIPDTHWFFNSIPTYVYQKVRLIFDCPTGSLLEALKESIKEMEWRLNAAAETTITNA